LIYDNGTNVGIGTITAPRKFTVNGSALFGSTTNPQPAGSTHIVDIVATGGNSPLCLIAGSGNLELWNSISVTRAVAIGMATPGTAMTDNFYISLYNGATWDTRLFINNSTGNVLIGTTTDSGYKLDVNGTGRFSTSSNDQLYINSTNSTGAKEQDIKFTNQGANKALIRNIAGGNIFDFYSYEYGIYPLRIASTGAATFNTSATTAISMVSTATASSLQLKNTGGTTSDWVIQSDGSTASAAFNIYSITASAYRLSILGNGNVGIGTTSPSEKLDVIGGAVAAGNGTIRTGITYSSLGLIGTFTNHNLGIITNGTTKLTLDTSGNLGLGVTPSAWSDFKVLEFANGVYSIYSYSIGDMYIDKKCVL
jgi:hypothetical protein